MRIKKALTVFFLVIIMACSLTFSSCSVFDFFKSDEQKITERIEKFEKNYNNGDWEGVLACLSTKKRNMIQAEINILGALLGSFTEISLNISDLFSIGVGIEDADYISVEIDKVRLTDSDTAIVEARVMLKEQYDVENSPTWFYMLKEENGWFIKDMVDPPKAEESSS